VSHLRILSQKCARNFRESSLSLYGHN
jgi:hypothetical protein